MTEDQLDQDNSVTFRKSLEEYFGNLEDYRREGSVRHQLIDILFITICAVICGANSIKAVALYAQRKESWLTSILEL